MPETFKVNAVKNGKDENGKEVYERSLDFPAPTVFAHEKLADMAKAVGEDYILHQVKNQMKIAWRSKMRTAMEKKDDNGDYEFNDAAMLEEVYDAAWTPELRVTKSPEERAMDALLAAGYTPAQIKTMLAGAGK